MANIWVWIGFFIFLAIAITIDSAIVKKRGQSRITIKAAIHWTIIWITAALIFNLLLWWYLKLTNPIIANEKAIAFLTGYLIEKSLSFDNLFAFYMVFHQFQIPAANQQRIFSLGIWGAIALRLILILVGTWLVQDYRWVLYIMGAFLLLTGFKMFFVPEKDKDLRSGHTLKFLQRHLRITHEINGDQFFVNKNKHWYATPLFIALIFIMISDIIFAFDSIPAIFAITTDPFIVWSSNIFAILGLRALYFIISGMISKFALLKYGIALILIFVGSKMLIEPWLHITPLESLGVITSILVIFSAVSYVGVRKG